MSTDFVALYTAHNKYCYYYYCSLDDDDMGGGLLDPSADVFALINYNEYYNNEYYSNYN